MAIQLGSELTSSLISKIRLESSRKSNEVVFLVSVDGQGFPNVALLSFSDLVVKSPKVLLFAIGENSSSRKNLTRIRKGSLVLWGGKDFGMFYIKGRIRTLRKFMKATVEGFRCSALILRVQKVSKDYSSDAKTLSTVTFDTKRVGKGHAEVHKELRSLAESI